MNSRRLTGWGAMAVAGVMVLAACGARSGDSDENPGITDEEVLIGISYPMTGPLSAFANGARGLEACVDAVNAEEGGVTMGDGVTRKITIKLYDDAYDPAKTVANIQRLVEQDKVFAVHNVLGTASQFAVIDYLNENEVPDVFAGTVGGEWSKDDQKWPWTVGFQPTIEIESKIYAEAILADDPSATVGVLYQNDDTGIPALEMLEETFEGTGVTIVRAESFESTDATVDSQVAALANSGASHFVNFAGPKAAAQSIARAHELGWKPKQYLLSVSTSIPTVLQPAGIPAATGIYSAEWLKVPGDAKWDGDPGLEAYRAVMNEYGNGIDTEDRLSVYGYTSCQALIGALEGTEEPTREALMESVRAIDLEVPTLLPGIKIQTDSENFLPVRQMQLQQFDGTGWSVQGDVIDGTVED